MVTRALKLWTLVSTCVLLSLVTAPTRGRAQEKHVVRPRKPIIMRAFTDVHEGILSLEGTGFGRHPAVAMGTSGAFVQLDVLTANDRFIEARLAVTSAGTYLVAVRNGLQFGFMNVSLGAVGPTGEPGRDGARGAPGPTGPQGSPGHLALANRHCPQGSFVTGFDMNGDLVCRGDLPPPPVCGDETVDFGEACDDGNLLDGDGCNAMCEIEDRDDDEVADPDDNCVATFNPDQLDTDQDGTGDACESTPVDVIFVVDGSASMSEVEREVGSQLLEFRRRLSSLDLDPHIVVVGDSRALCPSCGPHEPSVLMVFANVPSQNLLPSLLENYPRFQSFLRPDAQKHIVAISDEDDRLPVANFDSAIAGLADPGFPSGYVFHSIVSQGPNGLPGVCGNRGEQYLELTASTGGFVSPLECSCNAQCTFDGSPVFAGLATAVRDDVIPCDLFGDYLSVPPIEHQCALGAVNLRVDRWTLIDAGVSLLVAGTPGTSRSPGGVPTLSGTGLSCASRSFEVAATLAGTCRESYRLTGAFRDDGTWSGTLSLDYLPDPSVPGACFDCTGRVIEVTGRR